MRFTFLLISIAFCINTGFQDPPTTSKESFSFTLEAGETKRWKSSNPPSPLTGYVDVFSKGNKNFLVVENRQQTSVEFFPWEAEKASFVVGADSADLEEKCYMQGFYIASPDSVFILDGSNSKLHLLNKEGKLLKTHSWTSDTEKTARHEQVMAGIYSGSPAIRKGQWLNMSCIPFSGSSDISTFTKGKINMAINLNTGEVRYEYRYPALFKNGHYAQYYKDIKRCTTPEGKLLYSFGPEDSVRLTDYKNQEKAFFAGSRYFETPPPAVPEMGNTAIPPTFGGILYDHHNQVYYRMALHGVPDILEAEHGFDDQEISIIILDKEFKKIGETMLPRGKHNFRQWFVGPEGFYISNHHPSQLSPDLKEVSFTHYKLVGEKRK